jgi:hypothetical protein
MFNLLEGLCLVIVAYCTCVFGLIKMKFRRLIALISDDVVVLFCP